jgi:heptaprenyl diphosphate synthase
MAKKTARLAIYLSLAMALSALEFMLPPPVPLPGVKLGLANLVALFLLYRYGFLDALLVSVLRVVFSGLLFGGPTSVLYALPGALCALCAMAGIKRARLFSPTGASIAGGVFHNLAQLCVAILAVQTVQMLYYLPLLIASGALTGLLVGLVGSAVLQRTEKA